MKFITLTYTSGQVVHLNVASITSIEEDVREDTVSNSRIIINGISHYFTDSVNDILAQINN